MAAYALPALAALFTWWFSTGVILWLHQRPRPTHRWSLLAASGCAGLALYGLTVSSGETSSEAAYIAFLAAVVLWGWHELAFLQGLVTGPRKADCPEHASVSQRFVLAVGTLLYHEIALIATLGVVALITWGQPNQVGLWTFLVLFCMRLSAKLNIFLGVPHVTEEFLPQSLDFLKSYFGRRPMNGLFPVSITVATLAAAYVFHLAFAPAADAFVATASMLVGSLIVLGTLEHWFLVLALPDSLLWRWALRHNDGGSELRISRLFFQPGPAPGKTNAEGAPMPAVPSEGRVS